MRKLALGVLDQSPVPEGSSPPDALGRTVELAQACERLGFSRYWLAEHHNTTGLAGPGIDIVFLLRFWCLFLLRVHLVEQAQRDQ